MENLIKKYQKQNTDVLVNKLASATGDDLMAIEIVLAKRGQRNIKLTTDPGIISHQTGLSIDELEERGYYEATIEEIPEGEGTEDPAPKKKGKKSKEPKAPREKKEKVERKILTPVERAILTAINERVQANDGNPVAPVTLEDLNVDPEIKNNGSRLSGGYKKLIRKELIQFEHAASLTSKEQNSKVWLTSKGIDFLETAEDAEAKRVKKGVKDFEEEEWEEIEQEFEDTKKEYTGKVVSFKTNTHGASEVGLVTGAKLDRRSGYIFLNIKVGAERFNKRAKHVEVIDEQPEWLVAIMNAKAAKEEEAKAKKEAAKKAREEAAAAKKAEREAKKAEKEAAKKQAAAKKSEPKAESEDELMS